MLFRHKVTVELNKLYSIQTYAFEFMLFYRYMMMWKDDGFDGEMVLRTN